MTGFVICCVSLRLKMPKTGKSMMGKSAVTPIGIAVVTRNSIQTAVAIIRI